ncbi:hypothetical protein RHS01_03411 [Rhizoctonia solani]|uniref:Uncharacterized protein n=1 Tax=Rhizoctonia solani TaxID=456999 RepID=A0A8H7M703_9AGAM|nr:hypothetical protein RHS01_03411 [Rhizoctonia solani]
MSVFSASSLSVSDISLGRKVKPLPKRQVTVLKNKGRTDGLKQEFTVIPTRSRNPNKQLSFPARSRVTDYADGEGDYTDHLQQPNNTKKRKVPTVATTFVRESNFTQDGVDLIDEDSSQDSQTVLSANIVNNKGLHSIQESNHRRIVVRRKPVSLVTIATLRLKELMEARRKINLFFLYRLPPPIRPPLRAWSYGPKLRRRPLSRAQPSLWREPCFSSKFTFSVPSPISERYSTAKKTASSLKLRLQSELARQVAIAAEATLRTTSKPQNNLGTERKKIDYESVYDKPFKKSIKSKRRNGLLWQTHPTHTIYVTIFLRVYHTQEATQYRRVTRLFPPPKRAPVNRGELRIYPDSPRNEWICPLCEYSLFYGDEVAMQRATRSRRKVLIRRRNARERAAAAASGGTGSKNQDTFDDQNEGESEDDDESFGDYDGLAPGVSLPREIATASVQNDRGPHPGG